MRILNLGAGEQSTAVYFLAALGEIPPIDHSIFADTGEEPAWVHETVRALASWRHPETGQGGPPVLVRWLTDDDGSQIRLGDNLIGGDSTGHFVAIPYYIKKRDMYVTRGKNAGKNEQGKGQRQCTRDFKVHIVEAAIRREILGLKKGEAYRGPRITQVFGLDRSEGERIFRTKGRLENTPLSVGDFPLWDLEMTRADCREFLATVPGWTHEVLPSACTFCPLVKNAHFRMVRDRDPEGWARACHIDAALRQSEAIASKGMGGDLYVH